MENKSNWYQLALGLGLVISIASSLIFPNNAEARLIFSTEEDGINADAYHLDNDDSSVTSVDLNFGSASDVYLGFDKVLEEFNFSHDADFEGNEILDFLVENGDLGTLGIPTCDTSKTGRLYYDLDDSVLSYCDGSNWIASNNLSATFLTSLSGDGLEYDGTNEEIDVKTDNVTVEIQSDAVQVKDGGINTLQLTDDAVTNAKLADNSVNSTNIIDGEVNTDDLADNAVTGTKLASNSILTSHILDGEISTDDLADDAVTNAKLADNAVNSTNIIDGEVNTDDLADDAITNVKLADNSVGTLNIINGAVMNEDLADDSVDTNNIVNTAVTTDKIADGNVTTEKLADEAVTTDKIADGSITTAKLATSGINSDSIEDGSIEFIDLAARLGTETLAPEYPNLTLYGDGSNNVGTLQANYDGTRNYYQWTTNRGVAPGDVAQDYDLVMQWAVPENFIRFCDSADATIFTNDDCDAEIELAYKTDTANTAENKLDISMLDTAGDSVSLISATDLTNTTWTNDTIAFTTTGSGTFVPGDITTIALKMTSMATGTPANRVRHPVQIGAIKLNYMAK